MTHSIPPAQLLEQNQSLLTTLPITTGILDLACGSGRNGLLLAASQVPVIFADNNEQALAAIARRLEEEKWPGSTWQVNLEQDPATVLTPLQVDAILVFNYLHRPLFPGIKQAVRPGGYVFYETFTEANRRFGRPSNPDFLLRSGELAINFNDWEVLHSYEGELHNPQREIAQIIARRPDPDLSI